MTKLAIVGNVGLLFLTILGISRDILPALILVVVSLCNLVTLGAIRAIKIPRWLPVLSILVNATTLIWFKS